MLFLVFHCILSYYLCANSQYASTKDKMDKSLLAIVFISCFMLQCHYQRTKKSHTILTSELNMDHRSVEVKYNFDEADQVWFLDESLREISGLALNGSSDYLVAINDEKGIIYFIDGETGEVQNKTRFEDKGDYEGIAAHNGYIWILKSNGKLYKVGKEGERVLELNTPLSSHNNTEGLCFNHDKTKLLIACKGVSLNKKDKKSTKAIYEYDIRKEKLHKKPVLSIHHSQFSDYINEHFGQMKKVQKALLLNRAKVFSPSAIAVHPNNGDIYILSARGSMMIVYDANHQLKTLFFFKPQSVPQPEGICFDNKNNVYISTEGKNNRAKLFVFKPL
jgi:uncharacterized protein YjiK